MRWIFSEIICLIIFGTKLIYSNIVKFNVKSKKQTALQNFTFARENYSVSFVTGLVNGFKLVVYFLLKIKTNLAMWRIVKNSTF